MTAPITEVTRARKDQGECEQCKKRIRRGDGYKWVQANRFSPRRVRCADCPAWRIWEYSSTLSARIAQIEYDAHKDHFASAWENRDDVESFLAGIADEIEALAAEKREGAENIEEGFGHITSTSEELTEIADNLEAWADEFRGADVPDYPETEDEETPSDDDIEEWREACESLLDELLGNCPV